MTGFQVLTEFRFDVAGAILSSEKLQNSVAGISNAAEEAMFSMKQASMGFVANMGIWGGGIIGFFAQAIQSSEKFEQSQRNLANLFLTNSRLFKSINFNSAMNLSEKHLNSIGDKANEFGIDPTQLAYQTQTVSAMLMAKNQDDPMTLRNSIEISRGLLKSAPTLGINPGELGGQLFNMVGGHADGNNTLFQRLMAETRTFKEGGIKNAKGYNSMDETKRLTLFTKAITEFGNNTEVVEANMKSLTVQMGRFRSSLIGQYSIFRGIGKVLAETFGKILYQINEWINKHGKVIVKNLSLLLENLLKNPEKLYAQMKQMMGLKSDFNWSAGIVKALGFLEGLKALATFFKIDIMKLPLIGGLFKVVNALTGNFAAAAHAGIAKGGILNAIGGIFSSVARVLFKVFMPLMFFFQIFSRAAGYAQIANLKFAAENAARFSEEVKRLWFAISKIFAPIEMAIDFWARLVAWFFQVEEGGSVVLTLLSAFVDILSWTGDIIVHVISLISGVMNVLINTIGNLLTLNFGAFKDAGGWADEGYKMIWDQYNKPKANDEMPVGQNVTKIDKIEIVNQFKEQMEPDRIAFTLRDQLMKAAANPQQAAGGSLRAKGI